MRTQKLFDNKLVVKRNLQELVDQLKACEEYVDDVISGKKEGDIKIANTLAQCIGIFSSDDLNTLETMIKENYEDQVMLSTMSKL